MAFMVLLRLPTEDELEQTSVDAGKFLIDFNEYAVAPFVAKVEIDEEHDVPYLGSRGYSEGDGDWFKIIK